MMAPGTVPKPRSLDLEREDNVHAAVLVDVLVFHLRRSSEVLPRTGGAELVGAHASAGGGLVRAENFVILGAVQNELNVVVMVGADDLVEDFNLHRYQAGVFSLHDAENLLVGGFVVVVQELRALLTLEGGGLLRHGRTFGHEG